MLKKLAYLGEQALYFVS